ncbi:MAG: aldehyde ferredoxin oxidoreductase N-terminal domain-containing protein [Coriobacteriia bacterium]
MALYGHVGSIAIIDLTTGKTDVVKTEKYEEWVGGHALASALFWDYCKDKTVDAFNPMNVTVVASNPFSGTSVPTASARIEMTGIGSYCYPEWYTRSSMGGRIAGCMKRSGFDAVVITGKAESPVWINVVDGEIEINSAKDLWGLDCWETQEQIWRIVTHDTMDGEWYNINNARDSGSSTLRPGVMCIGPAGENLARLGAIMHDAGHAVGQSGFAAVWGSKNLKAISFYGTHSITIADPVTLLDLRSEVMNKITYNIDDPVHEPPMGRFPLQYRWPGHGYISPTGTPSSLVRRAKSCEGCVHACRSIHADTYGNEGYCVATLYLTVLGGAEDDGRKVNNLLNRLGINAFELYPLMYLPALLQMGIIGPGKEIDPGDLDLLHLKKYEAMERYLTDLAYRKTEFSSDLAEGIVRASMKWGRWETDSASGLLAHPQWGYMEHYNPRLEVEWSYGSMFGDRDINEHGFNFHVNNMPIKALAYGVEPLLSAKTVVETLAKVSHLDDPMCFDYSEKGIYSDAKLKAVSYHRHYTRFWTQSMSFCDWGWPFGITYNDPSGAVEFDNTGYEVKFFKAVTGKDMTHEESIELGHKIFTLDRAIWCIQGRHRDMEVFAEYVYTTPNEAPYPLPMYLNGAWVFDKGLGRTFDREKFEDVKTRFYKLEGWDTKTGWPLPKTLRDMGLEEAAVEMERLAKNSGKTQTDA